MEILPGLNVVEFCDYQLNSVQILTSGVLSELKSSSQLPCLIGCTNPATENQLRRLLNSKTSEERSFEFFDLSEFDWETTKLSELLPPNAHQYKTVLLDGLCELSLLPISAKSDANRNLILRQIHQIIEKVQHVIATVHSERSGLDADDGMHAVRKQWKWNAHAVYSIWLTVEESSNHRLIRCSARLNHGRISEKQYTIQYQHQQNRDKESAVNNLQTLKLIPFTPTPAVVKPTPPVSSTTNPLIGEAVTQNISVAQSNSTAASAVAGRKRIPIAVTPSAPPHSTPSAKDGSDIDHVPFKMGQLTREEARAKAAVELPFTGAQQQGDRDGVASMFHGVHDQRNPITKITKGGQITYIAGEEDDLDDSDPDDDLHI